MSFTAEHWAWEQDCGSGVAKSVLVYLAYCAGRQNGECFPGLDTIVLRVGHTERAVRKAIAGLIELGLVRREARKTALGRITSPRYILPVVSVCNQPVEPVSGGYTQTYPQSDPAPAKTQSLNPVSAPVKTQPLEASSPCENDVSAPAKTQPEPLLNLRKKESIKFSLSEGRKPRADEAEPTVAEIEARRLSHASTLAALPGPLADALSRLSGHVDGKAYAPGWGPRRDAETQIELLTPRIVRTKHLTPEQLALARANSGIRTVPAAAYQGASP